MIWLPLVAMILTADQVYVAEVECPGGVCSLPAPVGGIGIHVGDAAGVAFDVCVIGGKFTGTGELFTWIKNPSGTWSRIAQAQYVAAGSACRSWIYNFGFEQAGQDWRALAQPVGVGVVPGSAKLRITYIKARRLAPKPDAGTPVKPRGKQAKPGKTI